MKLTTTAREFINDYRRRGIAPDQQLQVAQGWLDVWLVGNSYAAIVRVGTVTMAGESLYINTYSPQDIADDICPRKDVELAVGIAEISGGAVTQ